MHKKILITTAIDYTNDVVHLGHSYQKVLADTLARYYRQAGYEVYFVTGTDEHGGNIQKSAEVAGRSPKEFVDGIVEEDKKEWQALNISFDRFIRTTDSDHERVVQDFWKKCQENGDIYKGKFKGWYCFGCESFKTPAEIVDGKCTLHPTKQLQEVEEENYFFAWSKYQQFLETLFEKNLKFVLPNSRYNEMREFLRNGIEDITISRSKEKVSWGILVPGDPAQVVYVWFDGLIAYFTAGIQKGFWAPDTTIIHTMGKDNTRWHALLWPAMLKSAGYDLPDTIYAHGFINLDGQKISKSLGNVIRPSELIKTYGADAIRYYLLRYGPAEDDVDLSLDKLKAVYNADLANDWGNLVSRITVLCEKNGVSLDKGTWIPDPLRQSASEASQVRDDKGGKVEEELILGKYDLFVQNFQLNKVLESIWEEIAMLNEDINKKEPWKLSGEPAKEYLSGVASMIRDIAQELLPFLPESSEKIIQLFSKDKITAPEKALFPRI